MAKAKRIEDYLLNDEQHATSLAAYLKCPASAFLTYICDAYDAFRYCELKFTKKISGEYNKDSKDSLNHICCALISTSMGHFETYQKCLLSGLIDLSINFEKFYLKNFASSLSKIDKSDFSVDLNRLLAQRGSPAHVGYVIADSVSGWHSPEKVNRYFQGVGLKCNVFSNDQISDLNLLWQIRHSIVHTGAWVTKADGQKVPRLSEFGDKPIVFENKFFNWFSRVLHKMVSDVNKIILTSCKLNLKNQSIMALIKNCRNSCW